MQFSGIIVIIHFHVQFIFCTEQKTLLRKKIPTYDTVLQRSVWNLSIGSYLCLEINKLGLILELMITEGPHDLLEWTLAYMYQ